MTLTVLAGATGALGLALLALTALTARRVAGGTPARDGFVDRWQALHGGYDARANVWVHGWLRVTYVLARPLARAGVQPDALTAWTLWLALVVVVLALAGGRWPLLAGALLVLGGLGDSLDGAVAALTERATRWGYVLDSLVDRINDLLAVAALVALGGRGDAAVACAVGFLLHDYLRARATNAGAGEVVAVTLGERAHRIILSALGLVAAGTVPGRATMLVDTALWVLLAFTAVGLVQLGIAVRRQLR